MDGFHEYPFISLACPLIPSDAFWGPQRPFHPLESLLRTSKATWEALRVPPRSFWSNLRLFETLRAPPSPLVEGTNGWMDRCKDVHIENPTGHHSLWGCCLCKKGIDTTKKDSQGPWSNIQFWWFLIVQCGPQLWRGLMSCWIQEKISVCLSVLSSIHQGHSRSYKS